MSRRDEWIEVTGTLRALLLGSPDCSSELRVALQSSRQAWLREESAGVPDRVLPGSEVAWLNGQVVVVLPHGEIGPPGRRSAPRPAAAGAPAAAAPRLWTVRRVIRWHLWWTLGGLLLGALLARCGAGELPAGRWVEAVLTAYSPLDALTRDDVGNPLRLTATGVRTARVPYGIAADPAALPYGSLVLIPAGLGYLDDSRAGARVFAVDDTGAIVRRRTRASGVLHLDLRYRTVHSARAFGVRRAWVYVIGGDRG